jgi:hypothetical protein
MRFNDILIDFNGYLQFAKNLNDGQPYPPSAIITSLYHPRYYPCLVRILKDDEATLFAFQQNVYKQLIPWLCGILPKEVVVEYAQDQYFPYIYISCADVRIGKIDLPNKTFLVYEKPGINALSEKIKEYREEKEGLEEKRQQALNSGDYATQTSAAKTVLIYMNKKHYIKKAMKSASEVDAEISAVDQKIQLAQMQIEDIKHANKETAEITQRVEEALYLKANIRSKEAKFDVDEDQQDEKEELSLE